MGLFAQIGLLAHLFSLIVPALGASRAGLVAGLATASATVGRTAFGWLMPAGADRRVAAALSYALQIGGIVTLLAAGLANPVFIILGVLLFGFGIGNTTSLPPLIAQAEFAKDDTGRVVALIVAMGQGAYAFAPAIFGLLRSFSDHGAHELGSQATTVFLAAVVVKVAAIAAILLGRRSKALASAT